MREKNDRVISVKNVINYIQKHIVVVIIFMFIGAVGLLGLCFIKNTRVKFEEKKIIDAKELYNSLSDEDKTNVSYALYSYESLNVLNEYIENALYMKLDPYNIQQTTYMYCIELTNVGDASVEEKQELENQLVADYTRYVHSAGFASDLASSGELPEGISSKNVDEVVFAGYDSSLDNTGRFYIGTYAADVMPEILTAMEKCIGDYSKYLNKYINHRLVLIDMHQVCVKNDNIYNTQRSYYVERKSINDKIDTILSVVSSDGVLYYNDVIDGDKETVKEGNSTDTGRSDVPLREMLKYGIVGGVLGIIGACGLLLIIFMFSKTILSETDYTYTMGLKYLGKIGLNTIDNDVAFVVIKIKAMCNKSNINKLAFISSVNDFLDGECEKIVELLKEQNIELERVKGVMKDCDAMDTLLKLGKCIMIEKTGKSQYNTVHDMVQFCEENDVNIMGVVDLKD